MPPRSEQAGTPAHERRPGDREPNRGAIFHGMEKISPVANGISLERRHVRNPGVRGPSSAGSWPLDSARPAPDAGILLSSTFWTAHDYAYARGGHSLEVQPTI